MIYFDILKQTKKKLKIYYLKKSDLYSCRFNFGNLGFWFPWSVVLLVVAAALFTYIALLLVRTLNNNNNKAFQPPPVLIINVVVLMFAGPSGVPSLWRTEALPPLEPQGDQRNSLFIIHSYCEWHPIVHICIHSISALPEKQLHMIQIALNLQWNNLTCFLNMAFLSAILGAAVNNWSFILFSPNKMLLL